jgi:hypothetical protein
MGIIRGHKEKSRPRICSGIARSVRRVFSARRHFGLLAGVGVFGSTVCSRGFRLPVFPEK